MTEIVEPLRLADTLYSRDITSQETNDRVFLPHLTLTEKSKVLLDAIEDRLMTNPSDFWAVVATLEADIALKTIGVQLTCAYGKYRCMCVCFVYVHACMHMCMHVCLFACLCMHTNYVVLSVLCV